MRLEHRQHQRQSDRSFGSRQDNDEQGKNLAVELMRAVGYRTAMEALDKAKSLPIGARIFVS